MKPGSDYIGVGVGALMVNQNNQLFLAKRGTACKNERGLWEFPGGAVEFGETLEIALIREMKEEFGIDISVLSLLDVVDHILPDEGQHWISPTYICKIINGSPEILEPQKCSQIKWFDIDEIPQPDHLSLITRINLKNFKMKFLNNK